MYKKTVFYPKGPVPGVKLFGQLISDNAKSLFHLVKCQCIQNLFIGFQPERQCIFQKENHLFSDFLSGQQAFPFICAAFSADSLYFKKRLIFCEKAVCDFFCSQTFSILQQIQNQKMKNNIIVCKTFCFPHPKQRIGVQKIAVDGKGNIRTAGHIIFPYIRTQPAFQPPALIVFSLNSFLVLNPQTKKSRTYSLVLEKFRISS